MGMWCAPRRRGTRNKCCDCTFTFTLGGAGAGAGAGAGVHILLGRRCAHACALLMLTCMVYVCMQCLDKKLSNGHIESLLLLLLLLLPLPFLALVLTATAAVVHTVVAAAIAAVAFTRR